MAQFDVHRNRRPGRTVRPFLVILQSRRFDTTRTRLVAPLVRVTTEPVAPTEVAPHFQIEGEIVAMLALELASIDISVLGPRVASLAAESHRIIAAIDEVIATGYG